MDILIRLKHGLFLLDVLLEISRLETQENQSWKAKNSGKKHEVSHLSLRMLLPECSGQGDNWTKYSSCEKYL